MKLSFLRAENTNKAIVLSMLFSMIAKVFNFGQSVVASFAFGAQASTDILFYMLSVVILLSTLLSSVNQQVIVPNVIYLRSNGTEEDSKKFISFIYLVYLVIGVFITFILMLWPEQILQLFSKFSIEHIMNNLNILKYIIPTFLLIIANTFILDIFTSYKYFTLPMILDMLKNLIIIIFVLIFKDIFSVASLALGVLMGNLLQFILLNYMLFSVLKCKPSFRRYHLSSEIKKNIGYVVGGFLTAFLSSFVVIYLMSGFISGVYSAMDYGLKISTVFSLVIVGQISTVVGMNIIELYAKNDMKKLNETFIHYFKLSLFLIIPFSFIIALNSEGIISLFFERGKFTRQSVVLTGEFLRYFILTLPYILINSFVVRLIIAKQIQRVAFWWQISQSVGNIIVYWLMINLFGFMGYPIGGIIASYIYIFLLLHIFLKKQFDFIDNKEVIKYFVSNGLLNFIIAAAFFTLNLRTMAGGSFLQKIIHISWITIAFILLNLILGYVTGINKEVTNKCIRFVDKKMRRLIHTDL